MKTYCFTRAGVVKAVDGVSFSVNEGEALGIVGESGCGKSMTCASIVRLVPQPAARIVAGKLLFDGEDLLKKSESEMRQTAGQEDHDDPPGSPDVAQPGLHDREPGGGVVQACTGRGCRDRAVRQG